MRLKSLRVNAFGCLRDWEKEFSSKVIVIYGNNEAGKSTFFHLMGTLFYGWRPVTNNPYLPWDGTRAAFNAELLNEKGELFSVQRSLGSQPQGKVIKNGVSSDLRNRTLEMLAFLPYSVFQEVYFLTLDKLVFPDSDAWQILQDQLLGGQYVSFLKPVSEVLIDLEQEANRLWRPDRRGKPRAKQLREEILNLKRARREAEEREEELRAKERLCQNLLAEEKRLQSEKTKLWADLNRLERLLPVKKRLTRIKELEKAAGKTAKFVDLPENPVEVLEKRQVELSDLTGEIEKLQKRKAEYQQQVKAYGETEQALVKEKTWLGTIIKADSLLRADCEEIEQLQKELAQNEDLLINAAGGIWQPLWAEKFRQIDEVVLRDLLQEYREKVDKLEKQQESLKKLKEQREQLQSFRYLGGSSLLFSFLGIIGLGWGGNTPLGFAGALLLILGLMGGVFVFYHWQKLPGEVELKQALLAGDSLKKELKGLRKELAEILGNFLLDRQDLGENLYQQVKEIKFYLKQKEIIAGKLRFLKDRLEKYAQKIKQIYQNFGWSESGDLVVDLRHLEEELQAALASQATVKQAEEFLKEIDQQLEESSAKKAELFQEKEQLLKRIEELPGTDLTEKIEILTAWRQAARQKEALVLDLEKEYPDWRDLKKEIEQEAESGTWLLSDYDLAERQVALEKIGEREIELKEEKARLETAIELLMAEERVADLSGGLQLLQAERQKVCWQRDRLVLLQQIIKEADQLYRAKHQPDVLQQASRYLEKITAGRYQRLFVEEEARGLLVQQAAGEFLKADFPLSRGTLEQIYLALRLALVKHLDSEKETVPLFLDEVLVNWDELRLAKGLEILKDLAEERQVFVLTCHQWLVKKMEKYPDVEIINLKY